MQGGNKEYSDKPSQVSIKDFLYTLLSIHFYVLYFLYTFSGNYSSKASEYTMIKEDIGYRQYKIQERRKQVTRMTEKADL